MSAEKLLKTLPLLHEQLDSLLEFEASPQVKGHVYTMRLDVS